MAFSGDFTPVLAKHSKSFSLIDCISVGVDRMQRNFGPMQKDHPGRSWPPYSMTLRTWAPHRLTRCQSKINNDSNLKTATVTGQPNES